MPGPNLILPGFYGKLPQAGDFVARRLPLGFVRLWDRWCARHLIGRLRGRSALGFTLAQPCVAATGIAVASADQAGRRFPLTLAAVAPRIGATTPDPAWLASLAAAASAAARGELGPDALDARLLALPLPDRSDGGAVPPLTLWTDAGAPRAVDPANPGPDLDLLLAAATEAS